RFETSCARPRPVQPLAQPTEIGFASLEGPESVAEVTGAECLNAIQHGGAARGVVIALQQQALARELCAERTGAVGAQAVEVPRDDGGDRARERERELPRVRALEQDAVRPTPLGARRGECTKPGHAAGARGPLQ